MAFKFYSGRKGKDPSRSAAAKGQPHPLMAPESKSSKVRGVGHTRVAPPAKASSAKGQPFGGPTVEKPQRTSRAAPKGSNALTTSSRPKARPAAKAAGAAGILGALQRNKGTNQSKAAERMARAARKD